MTNQKIKLILSVREIDALVFVSRRALMHGTELWNGPTVLRETIEKLVDAVDDPPIAR